MMPLCVDQGIGVIPWSPLARGRLTRPWQADSVRQASDAYGETLYGEAEAADQRIVEAVSAVAESRHVSRAQVALTWVAQQPFVTAPIVGASRPKHLHDAVAALDLHLDAEEIAMLERAYVPHAIAGHS